MKNLDIKWQDHLGIIASILLATLIVLKVYAVAGWNPTTATGVIAANGTSNVVIGSLLASLPIIYWFLFILVLPKLEQKLELKNKKAVEKYAVFTHTWPILLFLFIVPLYMLFVALALSVVIITVILVQRKQKRGSNKNNYVSRFEANTILLSSLAIVIFSTLNVPWLPAQAIEVPNKGLQPGYVLSSDGRNSVVLLNEPRQLIRVDSELTDRAAYCEISTHWSTRTLYQALGDQVDYQKCPENK